MERFVRMIFLAGQAVSLRAGSWEAVPMNCGWLEGVCQGREPGTWGGRGILTWALGAWHRSAEGHQAVSRAHTGASVAITRAGEGMGGRGTPRARAATEWRPEGPCPSATKELYGHGQQRCGDSLPPKKHLPKTTCYKRKKPRTFPRSRLLWAGHPAAAVTAAFFRT